jgi:FMN reductase
VVFKIQTGSARIMSIILLGGSPSPTSSGARLLQYISEKLSIQGHRCTTLQVAELPAHALLHADYGDAAIMRAAALLHDADAVVIATQVYKAAYSGILKAFLDLLPQDGLDGKLVLPLAIGGSQSHMLVLDYALRPVLTALSARFILPGVYATSGQLEWSEGSGLMLAAPLAARVAQGIDQLSSELNGLARAHSSTAALHPVAVAA